MSKEFHWMSQDFLPNEQFEGLLDCALTKESVLGRLASAIGQRPSKSPTQQDLENPILLRQYTNGEAVHVVAFHPVTVVAGANSRLGIRYFMSSSRGVRPVLVPLENIGDNGIVPGRNTHGEGFFVTRATDQEVRVQIDEDEMSTLRATVSADLGLTHVENKQISVARDDKAILGEDFGGYHRFFSGR